MANCKICGQQLTSDSTGETSDICPNCRVGVSSTLNRTTTAVPRALLARRNPPVTTALVAINVAVFAAMTLTGISPMEPTTAQILKWGANWGPLSLGGQAWRMLASNYIHIGIIHIGLNMWCLWNLGNLAERIFDRWTYVLVYTFCGLGGSLASLWWHPLVVGAGASGAIFGLAGALIAALYLGRLPIPKEAMRGTLKSLVTFAGYNLFFGAVGARIDNSAHIGGLVAGLALGALLARHLTSPGEIRDPRRRWVFVLSAVVLVALFVAVKRANGYVVSLQRGLDALEKGRADDALHAAEEAASRRPTDRLTLLVLGTAYQERGDYGKAEGAFQRVVQLEPNDFAAQYNLGLAQLNLGETDKAIASLNKAVHLNPRNAGAERALGQAYENKGMAAEAQAAFEKAAQLGQPAARQP